jgi:hypothetical protein
MKAVRGFSYFLLLGVLASRARAQIYDTNSDYVQTFAGSGFIGVTDGVGQLAMFNYPWAIVADSHSNLFVWDYQSVTVRKIAADRTVSTFAAPKDPANGFPTSAWMPIGFGIMPDGTLFLGYTSSDINVHNSLIKIAPDGQVTVLTNNSAPFLPTGGGIKGICADGYGNVYVALGSANSTNFTPVQNCIYRLDTNHNWNVFAGSGNQGYADGNGIYSSFNHPGPLAADAAGNVYVWDSWNSRIRRIDQNQNVTTVAGRYSSTNVDGYGTNAVISAVYQMACDNSGNLFLACGNCIRKMDVQSNVVTVAGSFTQTGYTNGPGNGALFNGARGICVSQGQLFVADSNNQRIRNIAFDPAPEPVSGAFLGISTYAGVTITGIVGRTYQIESSPDDVNWTPAARILLTGSPYLWFDLTAMNSNRFYRALLLP